MIGVHNSTSVVVLRTHGGMLWIQLWSSYTIIVENVPDEKCPGHVQYWHFFIFRNAVLFQIIWTATLFTAFLKKKKCRFYREVAATFSQLVKVACTSNTWQSQISNLSKTRQSILKVTSLRYTAHTGHISRRECVWVLKYRQPHSPSLQIRN